MKYFICLFSFLIISSCSKTPLDIPIGSQNNVEAIVTFSVNMSHQINQGQFTPGVDLLFMVGSFNGWDETSDVLIPTNDDLYEITFTTFKVDEQIVFKFKKNSDWETLNPAVSNCIANEFGGYDRFYIIEVGEKTVSYWYNDETGD